MNTTELFKQRKAVDLPSDSVRSLAMAAAAKGISLKKYLQIMKKTITNINKFYCIILAS